MTHHETVTVDARSLFQVLDDSPVEKQLVQLSPDIAALAMSGSSALVTVNALPLKRHRLTGTLSAVAADARSIEQVPPVMRG